VKLFRTQVDRRRVRCGQLQDRLYGMAEAKGYGPMADILLVDDSKTMRLLVQRAIRQAGYRSVIFDEAENGVQALVKMTQARPKLVVSDWNMPEMTGIDLLKRMRTDSCTVPLGFITSEASAEIKKLAMNSGASFLITKPFTPEDVQSALEPILGGA
jgi:two-component system chemotaxis response regulator CheY